MSHKTAWTAIAIAVACLISPDPASAQRGDYGICDELRAACRNKARLGERGEGNCRRMREVCERGDDGRRRGRDRDYRERRYGGDYRYGGDCRTIVERGFNQFGARIAVRRRICD